MTTSLWVILTVITVICVIIFKKTVSNDAESDFKIRDVLSRSDLSEEEEEDTTEPTSEPVKEETQPQYNEPENIYQKNQKQPTECEYKTNIHEESVMEKELNHSYQEQLSENICCDKDFSESFEKEIIHTKKRSSMFDYVHTFWHGITFAIGILVCLYSLFGIIHYVQTSNDVIIYSIWLLIGVILIK